MCLFVGGWVGISSGKGQRGQRSVYWNSGVCVDGEWLVCVDKGVGGTGLEGSDVCVWM